MIQLHDNTAVLNCKQSLLQEGVFNIFVLPSEVVEVRILNVWGNSPAWTSFAKGPLSESFDNFSSFGNAASTAIKKQQGIMYFTHQVIDHRLKGRRTITKN